MKMKKALAGCRLYIKQLGIKYFIMKLAFHILPILKISDTRLRSLYWGKWAVKKLEKYYGDDNKTVTAYRHNKKAAKRIWIFWEQGLEAMPEIVRACYYSVLEHCKEHEVVLLDGTNIASYIQLPEYMEQKRRRGFIPIAQYSDLLRISLLAAHGGIWMDATVFLTGSIPDYISGSKVFFYQASLLEESPVKISNWLISSIEPGDYIICSIRNLLYHYWLCENHLIHPFLFHLSVTVLYNRDRAFADAWDQIGYVCNMNPHVMYFSLTGQYSERKWNHICGQSHVHKLSWKMDAHKFEESSILRTCLLAGAEHNREGDEKSQV